MLQKLLNLMVARKYGVSADYVGKARQLLHQYETGKMSASEFQRRGNQLTEHYPDDWKRAKEKIQASSENGGKKR